MELGFLGVVGCWLQRCWELRAGQSCGEGREGADFLLCDGEGFPEDLNEGRRLCPLGTRILETPRV